MKSVDTVLWSCGKIAGRIVTGGFVTEFGIGVVSDMVGRWDEVLFRADRGSGGLSLSIWTTGL